MKTDIATPDNLNGAGSSPSALLGGLLPRVRKPIVRKGGYQGLTVTAYHPSLGGQVAIVAHNIETLRCAWDRLMSIPLDEEKTQRVLIVADDPPNVSDQATARGKL